MSFSLLQNYLKWGDCPFDKQFVHIQYKINLTVIKIHGNHWSLSEWRVNHNPAECTPFSHVLPYLFHADEENKCYCWQMKNCSSQNLWKPRNLKKETLIQPTKTTKCKFTFIYIIYVFLIQMHGQTFLLQLSNIFENYK